MAGKKEDAAAAEEEAEEFGAERIARWLSRHPDFFANRSDLLSQMTFPARWSGDGVIDMHRYMLDRRQDEIGTPLCVTVDFDSLDDKAVTIRERDTMAQVRVPIEGLAAELGGRLRI